MGTNTDLNVSIQGESHTRTITQTQLNIDTESLNQREQWLVKRLQGYLDLDLEIEGCQTALMSSAEPPSMTIKPPDEDDPYVLARYQEQLKPWQQEIATTIEKHVPAQWRYVTVERVYNALRTVETDNPFDEWDVIDAMRATERLPEERVELTPTERAVAKHEEMLYEVRQRLRALEHQKRVMDTALGQMEKHYPEWYRLLWRRYVMDEKYISFLMSTGMSEKFYRNERRRALQKFDKLAIGLR